MAAYKKFRIRELKMYTGEIRFIPEGFEEPAGLNQASWYRIGKEAYYLTMEQAKQQVDLYKIAKQNEQYTETIHTID